MTNGYQDTKIAQVYADFLDSKNGQIQQKILLDAVLKALPASPQTVILDAGCGTGWLAASLKPLYAKTYACDSSSPLITLAKNRYPAVEFSHANILEALPYPQGFFDEVIFNMAAPDVGDLGSAMKNISNKIKMGGRLIMTIPNPYYTYPVVVWKRSLFDVLLLRKPRLKIVGKYQTQKNIIREFSGAKIASNFYILDDYLTAAKSVGLNLQDIKELKSQTDSRKFDLNYQMFRYPLIILLEFLK